MTNINNFRTFEDELLLLRKVAKSKSLSMREILRVLSGRGRPIILILLSLPFCQPLQIPGLSMPFGLAIAFIGLRMMFGKRIWLPRKLLSKKITPETLKKITDKAIVLLKKMKPWIRPRLIWIAQSSWMEKFNGFLILILGFFLALPLPIPLTNLIAAWSIFFIALGILEDDGVFILIGYAISFMAALALIIIALSLKKML